jgi:hypothetical protein
VPRPSSPPGAKASTRCPSRAQSIPKPPCTGTTNTIETAPASPYPTTTEHPNAHISSHAPLTATTHQTRAPGTNPETRPARRTQQRSKTRFTRPKNHQPQLHRTRTGPTRHQTRAAEDIDHTRNALPRTPTRKPLKEPPRGDPPPTGAHGDGRVRTDDPLLAKQVLSQLSYAPQASDPMGQGGFEPPTPRLSSVCSNQLSY